MDTSAQSRCIERRSVPVELRAFHVAFGFAYGLLSERGGVTCCNSLLELVSLGLTLNSCYINIIAD